MKVFIHIKHSSQRVPNKNFRLIKGVPLWKHTLYQLESLDIYVDTDSDEIIKGIEEDSRLKEVTVYKRSTHLEGDTVSGLLLIRNFIETYNLADEYICQTHVTSPFVTKDLLFDAQEKLKEGYNSVVACKEVNTRFWRKESYGMVPVNHNPMKLEQTQDLATYYEETSTFYIFNTNTFMNNDARVGSNPYFYPLGFPFTVDIDTEDDWNLTKNLFE